MYESLISLLVLAQVGLVAWALIYGLLQSLALFLERRC